LQRGGRRGFGGEEGDQKFILAEGEKWGPNTLLEKRRNGHQDGGPPREIGGQPAGKGKNQKRVEPGTPLARGRGGHVKPPVLLGKGEGKFHNSGAG